MNTILKSLEKLKEKWGFGRPDVYILLHCIKYDLTDDF